MAAGIVSGLAQELQRRQQLSDARQMRDEDFQMKSHAQFELQRLQHEQTRQLQASNQAAIAQREATQNAFTTQRDALNNQQHQERDVAAANRQQANTESHTAGQIAVLGKKREYDLADLATANTKEAAGIEANVKAFDAMEAKINADTTLDPQTRSRLLIEVAGRRESARANKVTGNAFDIPNAPREQRPLSVGADRKATLAAILGEPDVYAARLELSKLGPMATIAEHDAAQAKYTTAFNAARERINAGAMSAPTPAAGPGASAPVQMPKNIDHMTDPVIMQQADAMARQRAAAGHLGKPWNALTNDERIAEIARQYDMILQAQKDKKNAVNAAYDKKNAIREGAVPGIGTINNYDRAMNGIYTR